MCVVRKIRELALPIALERSRSGKGAHIWFFFEERISARMVRAALFYIITLTLEAHPEISLAIMLDTPESISDISLYRFARREDALLQRNGYRILRFLAEDVCERLDAVLGEIGLFCTPMASHTT